MNKKIGILIVNLGTPDAPTPEAVKPFLAEFLMDPNVVSIPKWLWWFILHGIILRTRPEKSAEAYRKIWLNEGSPLLVHSQNITEKIRQHLTEKDRHKEWKIVLGMTYGTPSLSDALKTLNDCERIIVLPLYPQYSSASTASVEWVLKRCLKKKYTQSHIEIINNYYDHPLYITAVAESIQTHWREKERQERLLFSFHGMPERTRKAGDPYYEQCQQTARLVARELDLDADQWTVAFQSRFGREAWLKPYAAEVLDQWAKNERSVAVICPGFAADCLETLEEINMQYRDEFIKKGGKEFHYIPALNDDKHHINCLLSVIFGQENKTH